MFFLDCYNLNTSVSSRVSIRRDIFLEQTWCPTMSTWGWVERYVDFDLIERALIVAWGNGCCYLVNMIYSNFRVLRTDFFLKLHGELMSSAFGGPAISPVKKVQASGGAPQNHWVWSPEIYQIFFTWMNSLTFRMNLKVNVGRLFVER